MKHSEHQDPFEKARRETGHSEIDDQNDPVTMVLRHKDVRKCAHAWSTFSSEDKPGRIVVPSEVGIRTDRQIPFEVDPPNHGDYRSLVEPWFKRPLESDYQDKLKAQISQLVDDVSQLDSIEAVNAFSLRLQSRALTLLFNVPYEESEIFVSWGTHVFRSEDDPLDSGKAQALYHYIDDKIAEAEKAPGKDLISMLLSAEFQGRKLTKDEIKGVIILTFAGGRDTVINMVTNTLAYLADNPKALTRLREEPEIHNKAIEELIRYFSPLTHMGRVAKKDTEVCGKPIAEDSRISLCWASANRDEKVFENPNEVVLDRKINPHVSFGFGQHNCLGATHARQIMHILLRVLVEKVEKIEHINQKDHVEHWGEFDRKVGYHSIELKFHPR